MNTPNTKRIGALLCAALQISISPYALAECYKPEQGSSSGGLTGVFSVMKDGAISGLTTDTECNIKFYSSDLLGAQTLPQQGKDGYKCKSYTYNSSTSSFTDKVVGASGTYAAPITLGAYIPSKGESTKDDKSFEGVTDTLAKGDWATVKIAAKGGTGSNVTLQDGVKIKTLTMDGCSNGSTLTLAKGATVYIDELSWPAGCKLVVSETGTETGTKKTTTLNILGTSSSNLKADGSLKDGVTASGVTFNGGPTCINYSDAACKIVTQGGWQNSRTAKQVYDLMNNEVPAKLQINVRHGTAHTQGQLAIAAGIYVEEGNLDLQNGTSTTIVGQVVAKNISGQNNSGSSFFAKTSSLDSEYQTPAVNLSKYSDYSLAAAGVSTEVKVTGTGTDGKVFLAIQRDGTTDANGNNTAGVAGDLVVYGLDSKGAYVKTGAIYASSKTAKWADKYAKIYTDKAGTFSLIGDEKTLLSTYAQGLAANAVFARPWRTAPALVDSTGSAAIFATDDGVLYSVKADGTLNWGWMPSAIAAELKRELPNKTISDVIAKVHPWGQVRTIRDGNTLYITGTALGGALHFALKTNSDGSAVPSIGFLDYSSPSVSPGGEAYTSDAVATTWKPLFLQTSERKSWPFGGDAPVASATGVFDGKVAYIVDKKLVIRNIDGTGSVTGGGSNIDASSNLLYWGPGVLFVGTVSGKLLQLNESGVATEITATDESWGTLGVPVLGVQGAITNGGGKLLLAQTWTGVYAATWTTAGWKKPWYTKVKGSSSSTNPKVPPLSESADNSVIMLTTLPAIAPFDSSINNNLTGAVLIPYTKGSIAASGTTCTNSDISAWSFGPLDGLTGVQASNAKMGAVGSEQNTDRGLHVETGPGEATGLSIIMFKVNGDSYVGMENTASGIGENYADKAKQNNTVPDLSKIPDGGASGDATWTKATPPRARLNWRELTNFY